MNLARLLTDAAASMPDAVAVKLDDLEVTYTQLDGASSCVAGRVWILDDLASRS
jgi:non-ribosomal peptide synthetase component F